MKNYAGLDVSLKEVSICVVDETEKVVARGVAPADLDGISGWLTNRSLAPERIVHESGQLSVWLQRSLAEVMPKITKIHEVYRIDLLERDEWSLVCLPHGRRHIVFPTHLLNPASNLPMNSRKKERNRRAGDPCPK